MIALAVHGSAGTAVLSAGSEDNPGMAALIGLTFGFAAGVTAGGLAGLSGTGMLIAGGVLGLILAVLGAALYRVGVFLTVFVSTGGMAVCLIAPKNWAAAVICLAIALVAAILAVRFVVVFTIIATSIYGAAVAGTAVYHFAAGKRRYNPYSIVARLSCIIGVLVQLLLESRKQKKKSLQKAAEIREEKSTANEVERARAMMDDAGARLDDGSAEEKSEEDIQDEDIDEDDDEQSEFEEEDMTIIEFDTEDLSEESKKSKNSKNRRKNRK